MRQAMGLQLKDYLICVACLEALSPEELEQAHGACLRGDEAARRLIEERFLPRVVAWVLPYRGAGMRFKDLIQTGNQALLKALHRPPAADGLGLDEHLQREVEAAVEAALLAPRSR